MKNRSHLLGTAFVALAAIVPALSFAQTYSSWNTAGSITRAEFVRMVMDDHGIMPLAGGTHCFTDVGTQNFAPYVCAAKREGFITGDPNGRFRPNDAIAFIEAAAILVRSEGVWPPASSVWYRPYLDQMNDWRAVPYSIRDIFQTISHDEATDTIDAVRRAGDDHYDGYEDNCDPFYDDWCQDDYNNDDYYSDVVNNRDLRVTVTSSDDTPEPGDRITYRIRLENMSTREMRDARITAHLDSNMKFISASDYGDDRSDDVEWDNLRVLSRNTKTLLLTVEVDDNARDGDTLKLDIEGGERSVKHTVRIDDQNNGKDDIRISIMDSSDPVQSGDEVTYRITFRNMDNNDVTFSPRAYLDRDMDLVSVSDGGEWTGSTVRWNNINLNDDEERTFTLRARIKNNVHNGDRVLLRVEAGDTEDEEETLIDDNRTSNNDDDQNEDVTISMVDAPDPAWPGDQMTYRITLRNNENHDVRIDARAFLDGNTSFLFGSESAFQESTRQVLWRDVPIRRYESKVLTLTLRIAESAPRSGTLWFRVKAGDDDRTETTAVR